MVFNFQLPYACKTFPVFLSVLCDNLLLTVVVPILPELLRHHGVDPTGNLSRVNSTKTLDADTHDTAEQASGHSSSCLRELFHLHLLQENTQLGLLYSTKAFVQLICNPLVGKLTVKIGYKIPLCVGNFVLLLCSLVFGFADSIPLYTVGRSCHGLASALISISGMAIVAEYYQDDEQNRTKFLGRVMGAAALGVLLGYPFGGISFAIFGKSMPFLCIAALAACSVAIQLARMGFEIRKSKLSTTDMTEMTELALIKPGVVVGVVSTSLLTLLRDRSILVIVIAVWLTTTAMAVLEPTLPVWLMENMDPAKWQLGVVFVPDSLGYFIGTNCFGQISLRLGRWKMSMVSMATIGISCFMIPLAKLVWQLTLPHFALGLSLGIVDASLMPMLACLADEYHQAGYGVVYALAQTSVALAYSIGPLLGGELVPIIGFPDLMRMIGFVNLLFCPVIILLAHSEPSSDRSRDQGNCGGQYLSFSRHFRARSFEHIIQPMEPERYQRFHDELDSD
ncbi:Synaptic vesicular amine transporter [Folsomia candida]|uniref:Synaptic vesicular amine transporter n=2 Tax=Folsomia candida TaxID=158441 RepID=A0A226EW55_FOLCA|nr:Synaptic vesicular amine transporter [Folsomia candida]